jgi:hypothetical protein
MGYSCAFLPLGYTLHGLFLAGDAGGKINYVNLVVSRRYAQDPRVGQKQATVHVLHRVAGSAGLSG